MSKSQRRTLLATAVAALALVPGLSVTATAEAANGPAWRVKAVSGPTILPPGSTSGIYIVTATNTGDEPSTGPVTIEDELPKGVTATAIEGVESFKEEGLTCEPAAPGVPLKCTGGEGADPGDTLRLTIAVEVSAGLPAGTVVNDARVSEGGIQRAQSTDAMQVGTKATEFGLAAFETTLSGPQAGGHPNLTTSFTFNQREANVPVDAPRDIEVNLPPGLISNPLAVPRCDLAKVINRACPEDSAVGVTSVLVNNPGSTEAVHLTALVYNIPPPVGEPVAFAFDLLGLVTVRLDVNVRSGGDYGGQVRIHDISEALPLISSSVTLWGVPAEHNGAGPDSAEFSEVHEGFVTFGKHGEGAPLPFITAPQVCAGDPLTAGLTSLTSGIAADSWDDAVGAPLASTLAEMTECGRDTTRFKPSISVLPDKLQIREPAGYEVDVHVPQNMEPAGLGTPDLQNAVVTLPQGTVISPSAANGLEACSEAQVDLRSRKPASCPSASKVGTVEVLTPLLAEPLEGSLYIADQGANPFGSMFAVYIVAEGSGVVVKLAGEVHADEATGQLTTTFKNNPQLPFSDLKVRFNGGPQAPLANPATCTTATSTSQLTPYSSSEAATPSSSFEPTGCAPPRLEPSFVAGTTGNEAGAFGAFALNLTRGDQDEELGGLSVQMPTGLLGIIKGVAQCPEPAAAAGTCQADSLIGHVTVGAGPGASPFYLGGQAFLTGPYKGAPFGLSIVVPAIAGPFNLGNVVVRAAISVDAKDAHISIVGDPFPTIRDGVPLQVRSVTVSIDRSGFIFNPTSCEAKTITASVLGTQGATANVSSRYQAADCGALAFHPRFGVSSQGRTSRAGGASLDVKIGYPSGAQTNIRRVAVSLPKQLPSRLSTIQKACAEATFAANPAACPAASNIGSAKAVTPVLNAPLTGPAYLVSHGGAAFPDLVMVLQGQGVTLDLVGSINISKAGITSSAFNSVPDAPISSFELKLPEGSHSALTTDLPAKAKRSLCGRKLAIPTTLVGQDGAQVKQATKITITGCPNKHVRKKAKPKAKGKRR